MALAVNSLVSAQPTLSGARVRLVPPTTGFIDHLYTAAATGRIPWPWGGWETRAGFEDSLWRSVLVQFAIEDVRTQEAVGLLRADRANLLHGYAYVSMVLLPEYRLRVWPLEAAVIFGNYLFRRFDLANLYAETAAVHLNQFSSGAGRFFQVEARMRDMIVINGERQDLYVLKFARDQSLPASTASDGAEQG